MATLVTLAQAKDHLRVSLEDTDQDTDIVLKMDQASAMVLDRCNSTAHWRAITATWTDVTVPLAVQAAILLVLTHLHEHRGDDPAHDAAFWEAVQRVIGLHKDPVLA